MAGQGGGTLAEQIAKLEAEAKPAGVKKAKAIVADNKPEIVKLAFKYLRQSEGGQPTSIGKRNRELLANLPKAEAEQLEALLLKAKQKAK